MADRAGVSEDAGDRMAQIIAGGLVLGIALRQSRQFCLNCLCPLLFRAVQQRWHWLSGTGGGQDGAIRATRYSGSYTDNAVRPSLAAISG